jgi:threonine/homoserine/homoserine lactone efflux protein
MAIGPVAIVIIRKSFNEGFFNGLLCGLGASLGDFTFAFIAFSLNMTLVRLLRLNSQWINCISSLILILFGLYMLYEALTRRHDRSSTSPLKAGNFWGTYCLVLVNPLSLLAFLGLIGQKAFHDFALWKCLIYAIAVFVGSLSAQWVLAIAGILIGKSSQYFTAFHKTIIITGLNILSGIVIIGFGLVKLW